MFTQILKAVLLIALFGVTLSMLHPLGENHQELQVKSDLDPLTDEDRTKTTSS